MINFSDGPWLLLAYIKHRWLCLLQAEWNKIKSDKIAVDEYIKARSGESDFTGECTNDDTETKVKDYGFELLPGPQTLPYNKDLWPTISDVNSAINIDFKFITQL